RLLEVPGIGKGMLQNLQEISKEGRLALHAELLTKYKPSMLELLKIQGLGPKTIALIWSAYQIADLEGVEKLAREGKIRELPRMGEKQEQKLLKAIEDYRRMAGGSCSMLPKSKPTSWSNISSSSVASTRSRPPGRCGAAARRSATSMCWSPADAASTIRNAKISLSM